MSELSTEVKAKETHEKAVGYFKVSEQYGYKFIMEVKNIRDDRYYKELGFSSFDDYCQNAWGFKRRWIDTKIQAASNLKESDFEHFNAHLGATKTFLLATMEDEQREGATSKGIPTDKGYKSIDEATQKEINEYKRNEKEAKERAEQAEKQAEQARQSEEIALKQLEELESKEPESIEVIPEDYDFYKGNYESAVSLQQRYKEQMEEMRKELNNSSKAKNNVDDSEIEKLEVREKNLRNKIDSYEKLYDMQSHLEMILSTIQPKIHALRTESITNEYGIIDEFDSTLDEVIKVCNELKNKLPNKNIIEGEIVND